MEKRRSDFHNACKKYGLPGIKNVTFRRSSSWEFLINDEHKLVWCNVFKAGSTRFAFDLV
jgi:hypothetical protein